MFLIPKLTTLGCLTTVYCSGLAASSDRPTPRLSKRLHWTSTDSSQHCCLLSVYRMVGTVSTQTWRHFMTPMLHAILGRLDCAIPPRTVTRPVAPTASEHWGMNCSFPSPPVLSVPFPPLPSLPVPSPFPLLPSPPPPVLSVPSPPFPSLPP